jgi:hypothetical protein
MNSQWNLPSLFPGGRNLVGSGEIEWGYFNKENVSLVWNNASDSYRYELDQHTGILHWGYEGDTMGDKWFPVGTDTKEDVWRWKK